jgi:peptidoglycan/xylan/chitin deacetylase (PgdA/CDA1 family)
VSAIIPRARPALWKVAFWVALGLFASASLFAWPAPVSAQVGPAHTLTVPVLLYHNVELTPPPGHWGKPLTIAPAQFNAELDHLIQAGYHTVTLDKVYGALRGSVGLLPRAVVMTFDDGYLNNFTIVFPALLSHHLTGTFFVVPGLLGSPGYMSWDDVVLMSKMGMSIEAHTLFHPDLTTLTDERLSLELSGCRVFLRDLTGKEPEFLAYPFGAYNARVIAEARRAGYLGCLTVDPGTELSLRNAYTWPRQIVSPVDTGILFDKLL